MRWPTTQARTSRHNGSDTVKQSHLQACWPQRSPLTLRMGLPLCTHSSQPCNAGSNHHAPPPALSHLRWCHLAKCQVGLKARALPHTQPTARPSMANCCAGLSKALSFTPHAAQPRQTNTTKQSKTPKCCTAPHPTNQQDLGTSHLSCAPRP